MKKDIFPLLLQCLALLLGACQAMHEDWDVDPGQAPNSQIFHCGDGFSYVRNRVSLRLNGPDRTIYLRCVNYREGCPGTANIRITGPEQEWVNNHEHICHQDPQASGVRQMRAELLATARADPFREPREVLDEVSIRYPPNVAERLRYPKMRTTLMRAKRFPAVPATLQEFDNLIHQNPNIVRTRDNADMLYAGLVGPPGHQSAVFVSARIQRFMGSCTECYSDATFVPTPVSPAGVQVLQIVTLMNNNIIPLVVAIMESKTYVAYRAVLDFVQLITPRFQPRFIMLDYERQQQLAWMDAFPDAVIKGCYVHFVRAVGKKVAALGLRRLANRNYRVKSLLRAFVGLALLPSNLLHRGYRLLVRHSITLGCFELLLPFMYYFMKTWITSWRFRTLSVYNQANRTNNACESANRMLRRRTGPHHPSMWRFIRSLQRYEHSAYLDIRCWRRGLPFGRNRTAAVIANDVRIRNLTRALLRGNISIRRFCYAVSSRVLNLFNMYV